MANHCYNDYIFECYDKDRIKAARDFFFALYNGSVMPSDFYKSTFEENEDPDCEALIPDRIIYINDVPNEDSIYSFTLQTESNWWPDHEIIMRLTGKIFPGIRCYYCVECPERGFYECNDIVNGDYFLRDENGDFYEDAQQYKPGFYPDCSMRKQKGAYLSYDSFKEGE